MKKTVSAALIAVVTVAATVVLSSCQQSGATYVEITERHWTGWSEGQPLPTMETRPITSGDKILLGSEAHGAKLTIVEINSDFVKVSFNTDSIVKQTEPGIIDLKSKKYRWTEKIKYDEEYSLVTQTLDAGTIWHLVFRA